MRVSFAVRCVLILLAATAVIFSKSPAQSAEGDPLPAPKPPAADNRITPTETDRCPVCAMFPGRYPKTACAMTLKEGKTYYFCASGCLMRSWLRPTVYLGRDRAQIDRLLVKDYFTGKVVDARTATWVAGSDVVGPMGPAIVALADAVQLESFKSRHGGTVVFTFEQLDDALWKRIGTRELPPPQND